MATAGSIVANLTTRNAGWNKGMASASSKVSKLKQGVMAFAGVAVAGGTALAGMAAVGVNRLASLGDQLDKMSARTSFTVETLSRLKFAAEQSGGSIEGVGKSVRTMSRFMLNAERGMVTTTDALADLGLNFDTLQGQTQEQRFLTFARSIAAIEDPARQAALAMQVFGKGGDELLPLLQAGPDGIRSLMNEADELGITLSRSQATMGAKLADSFNRIKQATQGASIQFASLFAPAIDATANMIAKAAATSNRWIQNIRESLSAGSEWIKQNDNIRQTIDAVRHTGERLWNNVRTAGAAAWQLVNTTARNTFSVFTAVGGPALRFVLNLWGQITSAAGAILRPVFSAITAFDRLGASSGLASSLIDGIGRVATSVFAAMTRGVNAVSDVIGSTFETVFGVVQSSGAGVFDWMSTTATDLATTWTVATTMIEFGFDNFGAVAELAFRKIGLFSVTAFNDLGFFFTDQMPAWLTFFADNWQSVFFTAFDLVSTVFINIGENIRNVMSSVWDYIASGGTSSFKLAWKPLTEGFKNAISELPDIPKRQLSNLEQSLQADIDSLSGGLAIGLDEAIEKRLTTTKQIQLEVASSQAAATAAGVNNSANADTPAGQASATTRTSFAIEGSERGSVQALKSIFARNNRTPEASLSVQKSMLKRLQEIAKKDVQIEAAEAV